MAARGDERVRLHHRRRRLGRLRARRPADRGRPQHACCVLEFGGSDRSVCIRMPAALSIPMNMAQVQLALRDRAGAASRRPPPALPARQGPGRLVLDQRPRLHARQPARFRRAGRRRARRAGAIGTCCPISGAPRARQEGGDAYRGGAGPLRRATAALRQPALPRLGRGGDSRPAIPTTDDINGYQQEGFGRMDMTVKDGARWSARRRLSASRRMRAPNLAVRTHALATAHPVRGQARGRRALRAGWRGRTTVRARREVILAGGPINSPQLLKLSGIGPASELRRSASPVRAATCPASARTCRTTWNSISRSPARSRSRSIGRRA